jgi:predicted HTH transcriptional regulator
VATISELLSDIRKRDLVLEHQFVPLNPDLWKVANFREFLDARRALMARKLNEFMAALIGEPEVTKRRPVQELIALGEGGNLEFKSTLQWDVVQRQINKGLRISVLKTIAAFMNSDGGTLIIGVEDTGLVYGLDDDLKTVQHSTDKYLQLLFGLITEHMGPQYSALMKVRIEPINDKQVCVVDVDKAPEAVFVAGQKGKEFYIRVGNTTRALDPEQAVSYIDSNWS